MQRLRDLEQLLVRLESVAIVALVLLMLGLASYNVVYRNVLVPLQKHWAHSGPPIAAGDASGEGPDAERSVPSATPTQGPEDGGADDFGGGFGASPPDDQDGAEDFGGGFGDAADPPGDDEAADDFGGAFGDREAGAAPKRDASEAAEKAGADDFGGGFGEPEDADEGGADDFGGGFGKENADEGGGDDFGGGFGKENADEGEGDDFGGGFGVLEGGEGFGGGFGEAEANAAATEGGADPFADLPEIRAAREAEDTHEPQGGPPPPGSFAARAVAFIDAIKLDWIDIFLRQLVIIVSFLGAALATHRKKHINIDALSKTLPPPVRRWAALLTNGLAVMVCVVLAITGKRLVDIGLQYPVDLLPWAKEWAFQLMFPVGFGLLALHFVVRLAEQVVGEQDPPAPVPGGTAAAPEPGDDLGVGEDPKDTSASEARGEGGDR